MTTKSDLEGLLRRHIPADENRPVSDHLIATWMHELTVAETVVVTRVESYGPKLQASWLDHDGHTLASIAQPLTEADELRAFVSDWESFRREQRLPGTVIWRDNEMIP